MQEMISALKPMVVQPPTVLNASTASLFQSELIEAIASQRGQAIWVDMSEVESLDSAGLLALVNGLTKAQELESEFYLCGVPSNIRIVFELTQLDQIFAFSDRIADDRLPSASIAPTIAA
jgi:anti-sigma B factor antagonist